jgi:hypothetical protein
MSRKSGYRFFEKDMRKQRLQSIRESNHGYQVDVR